MRLLLLLLLLLLLAGLPLAPTAYAEDEPVLLLQSSSGSYDLDGEDLSSFKDARGVPIFVEFAEVVETQDEGYVDYVWQWFDDPDRLEPKQSYVKGFDPWGWVIGTGLYTDDVRAEIDRIERDHPGLKLSATKEMMV